MTRLASRCLFPLLAACGLTEPDADLSDGPPRTQVPVGEEAQEGLPPEDVEVTTARISLRSGAEGVSGRLTVVPGDDGVIIVGRVEGLAPESVHGMHIHESGACGDAEGGYQAAGGHFAPEGHAHGAPGEGMHHAGDLGNVTANAQGVAAIDIAAEDLQMVGERGVIGRTLVLHAEQDDLSSQPSGAAGPRLACGEIVASP